MCIRDRNRLREEFPEHLDKGADVEYLMRKLNRHDQLYREHEKGYSKEGDKDIIGPDGTEIDFQQERESCLVEVCSGSTLLGEIGNAVNRDQAIFSGRSEEEQREEEANTVPELALIWKRVPKNSETVMYRKDLTKKPVEKIVRDQYRDACTVESATPANPKDKPKLRKKLTDKLLDSSAPKDYSPKFIRCVKGHRTRNLDRRCGRRN